MSGNRRKSSVLVIGAGIAGLCAADLLAARGHDVTLVDKGRCVGGRMATRRRDRAVFDHGSQSFTAHHPGFARIVGKAIEEGAVTSWYSQAGVPLYRGRRGMTSLPKLLASRLAVQTGVRIVRIERSRGLWHARAEDGTTRAATDLLITAPLPQTLELLDSSGVSLDPALRSRLEAVTYSPCSVALATLSGVSGLVEPGFVRSPSPSIAWIADNGIKGISERTAITIQSTPRFAQDHLDEDPDAVAVELLREAMPMLASAVEACESHRWRYSAVSRGLAEGFERSPDPDAPIFFAGDAFGGSGVEGAALSGLSAAEAIGGAISELP